MRVRDILPIGDRPRMVKRIGLVLDQFNAAFWGQAYNIDARAGARGIIAWLAYG